MKKLLYKSEWDSDEESGMATIDWRLLVYAILPVIFTALLFWMLSIS